MTSQKDLLWSIGWSSEENQTSAIRHRCTSGSALQHHWCSCYKIGISYAVLSGRQAGSPVPHHSSADSRLPVEIWLGIWPGVGVYLHSIPASLKSPSAHLLWLSQALHSFSHVLCPLSYTNLAQKFGNPKGIARVSCTSGSNPICSGLLSSFPLGSTVCYNMVLDGMMKDKNWVMIQMRAESWRDNLLDDLFLLSFTQNQIWSIWGDSHPSFLPHLLQPQVEVSLLSLWHQGTDCCLQRQLQNWAFLALWCSTLQNLSSPSSLNVWKWEGEDGRNRWANGSLAREQRCSFISISSSTRCDQPCYMGGWTLNLNTPWASQVNLDKLFLLPDLCHGVAAAGHGKNLRVSLGYTDKN